MAGPFAVVGTLFRGYNRRAVRILVEGGLDRGKARAIASAGLNRTFWTGRLVPDRLFEAGVSPQVVGSLDKAGLLGTKYFAGGSSSDSSSSINESIRRTRIPLEPISESELSAKVGEKVKFGIYTNLTRDLARELRKIVRESLFRELWPLNEDFEWMAAQKDFRIIIVKSESSGKILGFAVGLYDSDYPDDAYYIHVLAVRNHYCGKGIGKALLQAHFKELSEPGYMNYKMVYLSCSKYDKYGRDLVKYYQKYGFVKVGIKRGRFSMVAPTAHYEA